jgi:hypothetical protein
VTLSFNPALKRPDPEYLVMSIIYAQINNVLVFLRALRAPCGERFWLWGHAVLRRASKSCFFSQISFPPLKRRLFSRVRLALG